MSELKSEITVSIIIVSFNKPDLLKKTIKSILENVKNLIYEIIVFDNASFEDNVQIIKSQFHQVKIIENSLNLGFARACNQASKAAKGKFLLFVNSDILLSGNPINKMTVVLENNDSFGLLGASLMNEDGTAQPSFYGYPKLSKRFIELFDLKDVLLKFRNKKSPNINQIKKVDIVKGAFLLVRRSLFLKLNGFDEDYFMYVEDADLSLRVAKLGLQNVVINTGNIYHLGEHHESPSHRFVFYYRNKGLIQFYKKNCNRIKYYIFIFMNLFFFKLKYYLSKSQENIYLKNNYRIISKLYLKYSKI